MMADQDPIANDREALPPEGDLTKNKGEVQESDDAATDTPAPGDPLEEDAPELLGESSRTLTASPVEPSSAGGGLSEFVEEVESDTSPVSEWDAALPEKSTEPASRTLPLDQETSTQRIAGELRRIESEVRRILDNHDTKRKRKLAGTRRWNELEEDILQWKFSGRVDETILRQLHSLVMRRHHLFNRLRFLAATRPTWNS